MTGDRRRGGDDGCRGRVLLGRRVKDGEEPSWCLPGGAVEAGESFEDAALRELRELREETGIADAGPPRVPAVVVDHPDGAVRATAAVAMTLGDSAPRVTEPRVFRSWEWFSPDRLPSPLFPATAHVLNQTSVPRYEIVPNECVRK